jgi:hypothetical protein
MLDHPRHRDPCRLRRGDAVDKRHLRHDLGPGGGPQRRGRDQAILEVGVFPAFPLWSLVVIALDVVVIYQLTANWETAR